MVEPLREPQHGDDTGASGPPPEPTPRWVKVFGIVGLVVVLLLGALLLAGGGPGGHGPGRHAAGGALSASVAGW